MLGTPKTREPAIKLAARGLSYAQSGPWLGGVKSALCHWRRRARAPELQQGAVDSAHLVSDGDWAITVGLGMIYGGPAPRQ